MGPENFPLIPVSRVGRLDAAQANPPGGPPALLAAVPRILSGNPDLWGLLAAFRRRWRLAVGLGLLVGAVVATVTWYVTASSSSFTAVAMLRVDSQKPRVMFDTIDLRSDFGTYQRSQVALVKSRVVLSMALRDPKVAQLDLVKQQPDPVEWLEKQIQVDFSMSPEFLRISMSGKDEAALLALVTAVRDAYFVNIVDAEHKQREDRLNELLKLNDTFKTNLGEKRKHLTTVAKEIGSRDAKVLGFRQENLINYLNTVEQELLGLQAKKRLAQLDAPPAEGEALEELNVPDAIINETIAKDPVVDGYQKEIARLDLKLAQYEERSPDPAAVPNYIRDKAALLAARKALASRQSDLRPKVEVEAREQWQRDLKHTRAIYAERMAHFERLEAILREQINLRSDQINKFGEKTIDLAGLQEEIELVDVLAKRVGGEVEALRVELEAPTRVSKWSEPYMMKHEGLKTATIGGGLGGFLAVVACVTLLEFRTRRVGDVTDVSRGLQLPVVGTMPLVRSVLDSPKEGTGRSAGSSQQILIESVDSARTMLLHEFRRRNLQLVMVTSAGAGEGKTLLSAHLSASLARAGWRVLLVDGDLRRPSLHKVFGFEPGAGLGEALRGEVSIREILRPGPVGDLWVVPAGHGDAQSLRGLAQGKLTSLFDDVKKDFDFIILDSPPILPVADAQLMAQAVDGVILSVLQNVSRLPFVYAAYERLSLLHANLIGAVVHGKHAGAYGTQFPYLSLPVSSAEAPKKAE